MASKFLIFSLLLPFNGQAPCSPSLSSELQIDVAEPVAELGGVLSIRLGEVKQRAEGKSARTDHGELDW